jgi:Concanavalin A-like lectin/glucanases superfamily
MTEQVVTIDPAELPAEPGSEASCRVRIRNGGTTVDEFTPTVLGPAAAWATVQPAAVRLFPGDEEAVTVRFRPPRSHLVAPGPVIFGVRVVPTAAGDAWAVVEEGTLVIGPFTEVVAVLRPRQSRGRLSGRHRLLVTNRGNVPMQARFAAVDPDERVGVRFRPEQVQAGPGGTEEVAVRVRPRRLILLGAPEQIPFEVAVEPTNAPSVRLQASMDHRRLIPRWVPVVLALAAALLIAALVLRARSANPVSLAVSGGPAAPGTGSQAAAGAPNPGTGTAKQAAPPPPPAAAAPPPPPVTQETRGVCPTGAGFARRSLYVADGTAKDSGGGGQDGTLLNGAAYGPGSGGAPPDQAFAFNGGYSAVDVGPAVGDLGTSNFCVSMDLNTSQQGAASLIGNRNSDGDGQWWTVRLSDTGQPYLELDDHGMASRTAYVRVDAVAPQVNDGHWHNLTVLRLGTLLNVYVDRELVGSATSDVIDVSNGAHTRIGSDGFLSYTGAIDEILIARGT